MQPQHQSDVNNIASQVRKFYTAQKPFRVYHGSTNSTRILSFKRDEMLDVSHLNRVMYVDTARQVAVVEPNVPMDKLLDKTLEYGLLPPVITEFPGITVGGGIQGGAGESSSFKWGFLSQATNWHEYVLGNGKVVRCSPQEEPDLFYGAAGSCGTLGVITAAELQLIPARKFVNLTYIPVNGFQAAIETLQRKASENWDFLDGIIFGANHGLVIAGYLSDTHSGKVQCFGRARDPWFYLHAEKIDSKRIETNESVPLRDYLFRYDRGAFWVGRFAFERFNTPFNRATRFLLDPLLHTRKLYQALQDSGASQEHIVQDLTVPLEKAVSFLTFLDKKFGIYPLWLCPVKPEPRSQLLCNGMDTPLAINVGVWGPRIEDYDEFLGQNKEIETSLQEFDGKKWLYAHTYYTEKEFWQIYNKRAYSTLRRKYAAETLPDIYEKVRVKKRYKINTKRGLFKTMLGQARLRIHE